MAPPPTLPADVARRAEPPVSPAQRSREAEAAAQLTALLTSTQRLEQAALVNTTGLHELREELQSVRGQLRDLSSKELTVPSPLITPPPRPSGGGRVAATAAVIAAIAALGSLAGAALVIREQKQQQNSLAAFAVTAQSLGQTVARLGETVAAQPPAGGDHAAGTGKPGAAPDGGNKPTEPQAAGDNKAPVCPPAVKTRVLLPNLVGLRLAEARAAVAPLQLQLVPTDKKLKEASKIGWQLPNPGAEFEPDESSVQVSLKPPVQKKKKK